MKLTLIVPGLLALPAATLAAIPALNDLARHAGPPALARDGLLPALANAFGIAGDAPLAPLLAAGAGMEPDDDYVLVADPVTLVAGRDDVVLAGKVTDLDRDAAAALIGTLNRHFAGDAIAFVAPRPDAWFLRAERDLALVTTPTWAVLGQPIFAHLPRGPEGKTWQRWQTEIQMLLFENDVNNARERRGLPPVSGVWLWGGGRLPALDVPDPVQVFAAEGIIGDLARGLARQTGHAADGVPAACGAMLAGKTPESPNALVTLPEITSDYALAQFAADWLAPAVAALARGGIDALDVIADGGGMAACWTALRPSAFRRFAKWRRSQPFALPRAADA